MAVEKEKPRKAWIIIYDEPRNHNIAELIAPRMLANPLAIYPPGWKIERLLPVIDGFVQFIDNSPEDKISYLRPRDIPYPATVDVSRQYAEGGYDPYVLAIKVDDLTLCCDTETGQSWFEYTRNPAKNPRFISDRPASE